MVIGIVGKIGSGKSEVVDYLRDAYNAAKFSCDEVAKEIMVEEGYEIDNKQDFFTNENILERVRIELHPKVFSRINEYINILNNFYKQKELIAEKIVENIRESGKLDAFINFENILDVCDIDENKNNRKYYNNLLNNKPEDIFSHMEKTLNFSKKRRTYYNKKKKSNSNNILEFFEDLIIVESALPSEDMFNICDKMIYIDCSYENRVSRLKKSRKYSDEKIKQIFDSQQYYEDFYNRYEYKILNDGSKKELINKVDEVMNEIYIACKQ